MTRVRWWMLSLVFLATTINYLDRIVVSVLIPTIQKDLHINDVQYGYITAAFQLAYTVGFLLFGWFIDRYGTRIGYALSIFWWSVAAVLHAVANSAFGLGFWRAMLGFGEAGNFPAAIKSVAEWFPKKDRALATGIFNSGTNVASTVGPPLLVVTAAAFGWRACFVLTGAVGFLWLVLWMLTYRLPRDHKGANQAEIDYIHSDPGEAAGEPEIGWVKALGYRQTWGFAMAKFLSDPVWWFYLFWLPKYLQNVRKLDATHMAWAISAVYLAASVGSLAGGWVSGFFIGRGWPSGKARKAALAMTALCMPVAAMAVFADQTVLAVLLVCFATAGHQGWSANLYTTASDVFPKSAVASVTGLGGCAGGLGGILFSAIIPGYIVTWFGYTPVFLTLGCFHLIALALVHFTMGDMQKIHSR
jgi:ACS family hexuronate transporter-like MFS transporter